MRASIRDGPVDHEQSYRGLSLRAFFHRARFRVILATLRRAELGTAGRLADFGCSNGFILSELRAERFPYPGWGVLGFGPAPPHLHAAPRRRLPGAAFQPLALDHPRGEPDSRLHP